MFGWFKKAPAGPLPDKLYQRVVEQSRLPVFYQQLGVADTPDGRFDVLVVHAWLVMRRLRGADAETSDFSQALFDLMFDDMDRNLRELGVGDMGIGKRIKGMAQGFYGRVSAYDQAVDADDMPGLCEALRRNAYRGNDPTDDQVAALAHYIRREDKSLADQAVADLVAGEVIFGAPTVGAESRE